MLKSKNTFRGGYYFRNFNGIPTSEVMKTEVPKRIVIPLKQGFGASVPSTVTPGEVVKAGQIIGRDDESIASPVHATIDGKVKEIKTIDYQGTKVEALVIEGGGSQNWQPIAGATKDSSSLSPEAISELVYLSGASALGATGIPTFQKSSRLMPDEVKYIVISALETHPFPLPTVAWIDNKVAELVQGLQILQKLMPNASIVVGVSKKDDGFIQELDKALKDVKNIAIRKLKPKYPQEMPIILTETLTGEPVADGKSPESVKAIVLGLSDVLSVYEAVVEGKPLIHSVVSLGGPGYKENKALKITIGTSVQDALATWQKTGKEYRTLFGNALIGNMTDPGMPIGRDVSATTCLEEDRRRQFLFFMRPGFSADSHSNAFAASTLPTKKTLDTNVHGEPRPCIQCSYCEEVCPKPLYPSLLHKYCSHGLEEEALGLRLLACVECGLCSYVCPSKVEVMDDIQKGKSALVKEGLIKIEEDFRKPEKDA